MKSLRAWSRIHMVGIGGCGMSGLAGLLCARGVQVSGSDAGSDEILARVRRLGARATSGHAAANLPGGVDVVVHSAAIPSDNVELAAARERGLPVLRYAEFLGQLVAQSDGLAVAGTHGKTSTAGMLVDVLLAAGEDPSLVIGADHDALGQNFRNGSGSTFLVEACEYERSFLSLSPRWGVITNLELDHPEVYRDEAELASSFTEFVGRFRPGGLLVVNGDSRLLREVHGPASVRRVTFGYGAFCEWRANAITGGSRPSFSVHHRGRPWGRVQLSVPGRHSVSNALAAVALTAELGLPRDAILEGLRRFSGMNRRFQQWAPAAGVEFVDDYAHHPTEVASALAAARDVFPGRRLWALFQPHQLGRLKAFSHGFARALAVADRVVLLPVFTVREKPGEFPDNLLTVLAEELEESGNEVWSLSSFEEAVEALPQRLGQGDVCVALGAGDINRLTGRLRQALTERVGAGS